jgi:hypothetical protein
MKNLIKKNHPFVLMIFLAAIGIISCQNKNLPMGNTTKNIQQIIENYPSFDIKNNSLNTDEIFTKDYKVISKLELDSIMKDSDELNRLDGIETQIIGKQKINNNYFLLIKFVYGDWIVALKLLSFDQHYNLDNNELLLYVGGEDEESEEPFIYKQEGVFLNDSTFQVKSYGKLFTDTSDVLLNPIISYKRIFLK